MKHMVSHLQTLQFVALCHLIDYPKHELFDKNDIKTILQYSQLFLICTVGFLLSQEM